MLSTPMLLLTMPVRMRGSTMTKPMMTKSNDTLVVDGAERHLGGW
jgi:hypothetical protein